MKSNQIFNFEIKKIHANGYSVPEEFTKKTEFHHGVTDFSLESVSICEICVPFFFASDLCGLCAFAVDSFL
jgi:hypothetical protein